MACWPKNLKYNLTCLYGKYIVYYELKHHRTCEMKLNIFIYIINHLFHHFTMKLWKNTKDELRYNVKREYISICKEGKISIANWNTEFNNAKLSIRKVYYRFRRRHFSLPSAYTLHPITQYYWDVEMGVFWELNCCYR